MKKKISLFGLAIVIASLTAVGVVAQQPPPASPPNPSQQPNTAPPAQPRQPRAPRGPRDPLHDAMFPPEMIMQHQRELGLTDEQKAYMRGEINKTTTRFNELQWQLQDAMEALHATMKENTVNEQLALSQLEKVLDNERDIKRLHMELAIRIKNKLTPDQKRKLHEMRRGPGAEGGPGHGPGHGPGGPGSRGRRPDGLGLRKIRELYQQGRDDEAIVEIRKLLLIEPTNAEAFLLIGRMNQRRKEQEAAIEALKTAIFWDPSAKSIDAHILLGRIFLERKDVVEARKYAANALTLDPNNKDAIALQKQVTMGKL